jgi:ribose transport system substrate-binding protein
MTAALGAGLLVATFLGTSGASAASGGVAQATAAATKSLVQPKTISITTPLKNVPPKGRTVVILVCNNTQCATMPVGLVAATKAVGWNTKQIVWDTSNPASVVTGMQQALQFKPYAVLVEVAPYQAWSSVVPAYQAAGVKIVSIFGGPSPINKTIIADVGASTTDAATAMGNYVVSKSKGAGNVLTLAIPAYATLAADGTAFDAVISKCSGCTSTVQTATAADVANAQTVPLVVSALQKNPKIKWVFIPNGPFAQGLPAALTAAGISGVNIVSLSGGVQNQQDILSGTELATVNATSTSAAYYGLDATLRNIEGMKIPAGYGAQPFQILTKATIVPPPKASYDLPFKYAAQFKKLWKVSK